ncbi:MAG TPA: nucleotidyltransferase family protein [Roseiarcus sp.]|nr:nucleotidyltransferase family protein [Roseiarcus sp.]
MVKIAAILLAAGRSARFAAAGGREATKLAALVAGKPLARYAAEAALASSARPVVVVTGHARDAVETALRGLPLRFVHNPAFASGLASSLKAGLAVLPADIDGVVVLLADMPAVAPALIDRLAAALAAAPEALAAIPVAENRRGNPVLLARAVFPAMAALEGDEGARRLLAGLPGRVIEIPAGDDGATLDVDTPEALAAARLKFGDGGDH